MNVDDLILVSIDVHDVEPPDMFDHHDPFDHIARENSTIGRLHVDTATRSRAEWRQSYESAHAG